MPAEAINPPLQPSFCVVGLSCARACVCVRARVCVRACVRVRALDRHPMVDLAMPRSVDPVLLSGGIRSTLRVVAPYDGPCHQP